MAQLICIHLQSEKPLSAYFYDDPNCMIWVQRTVLHPDQVVMLLRPWLRCFAMINISAWWLGTSSKFSGQVSKEIHRNNKTLEHWKLKRRYKFVQTWKFFTKIKSALIVQQLVSDAVRHNSKVYSGVITKCTLFFLYFDLLSLRLASLLKP